MASAGLPEGCSFGDCEGGFHGLIFLQIARARNKTKHTKDVMPISSRMSSIKWRIMSGVSVVASRSVVVASIIKPSFCLSNLVV
jgi:hypothetical protein